MLIKDFYEIIENEGLDTPFLDTESSNKTLVYGYYRDQNNFIAYRANKILASL